MRWINRFAAGIVAIPGPVWASRNTYGVDPQVIAGCFDKVGSLFGVDLNLVVRRFAVLQQNECPQGPSLRSRRRGLAHVMPVARAILQVFSEIAEIRAREHICAFRHTRNILFIDIGRRFIHPFERFKRMRPINKTTILVRDRIARVFRKPFAEFPRNAKRGFWLLR